MKPLYDPAKWPLIGYFSRIFLTVACREVKTKKKIGLHSFQSTFLPTWEPRYLIHPGPASLPAVIAALVKTDSGDDFFRKVIIGKNKK